VDVVALFVRDLLGVDAHLPRRDVPGELGDVGRVVGAFQRVDDEPAPAVREDLEDLLVREVRRVASGRSGGVDDGHLFERLDGRTDISEPLSIDPVS